MQSRPLPVESYALETRLGLFMGRICVVELFIELFLHNKCMLTSPAHHSSIHLIISSTLGAHKIWVAITATIRRNVNTPPPVCSIIIHVDMVFCGEENGRDSIGWPTIEFVHSRSARKVTIVHCPAHFMRAHAHRRPPPAYDPGPIDC